MKIVFCIEQVPEISEVMIDPKTHTLIREGVPSIINPFGENVVEEAIRIREKISCEVIIITRAPTCQRRL